MLKLCAEVIFKGARVERLIDLLIPSLHRETWLSNAEDQESLSELPTRYSKADKAA
jgi:hypothetical protein